MYSVSAQWCGTKTETRITDYVVSRRESLLYQLLKYVLNLQQTGCTVFSAVGMSQGTNERLGEQWEFAPLAPLIMEARGALDRYALWCFIQELMENSPMLCHQTYLFLLGN